MTCVQRTIRGAMMASLGLVWLVWAGVQPAGAAEPAGGLDRVRLQLKWQHQFQFAGYYAAVTRGYYREAGLEVELIEAQPGVDAAHVVLGGKAEFGVGTSDLILLRSRGEPVVVLASIFQHSPLVLLARRGFGVDDLHDLHDQPVMIEPGSAELFAYFRNEGVDPAKLKIEPHTFDVKDLLSGRVAGMSAYQTDEPFLLKRAGVDYLTFTPRAGGIDFYGDNLFTTEEQIRSHPDRVKAFRAASLRGWDYALANPGAMIDQIRRDYPGRKDREHLEFEAEQVIQLMHPGLIETGHMNPGRWGHMVKTYEDFGMLAKPVIVDDLLYDVTGKPDLRWVYWALGALGLVALGLLGWLLPLLRLNAQLRKAKENAETINVAKSRYLAFISHEIRTPLNGVVGVVQLLKCEGLTRAQSELVALIEQCADSLLKLINGLLDQAQIESGRVKIEILPLPARTFVAEICELFSAPAKVKGLSLRYTVDDTVPQTILTDGLRLRQILSNLLSNAVKFTDTGGVELQVSAKGGRVWVRVSDTGMGLTDEQAERLFMPYIQADATIARRYGGTGLGLAISRDLARLLGGDITVESRRGSGAVFIVEIKAPEALSGGVV
ncbi:MAG: ABC transporter substrate-binding protein [Burkholderiales bacterium]|nr:ABC transporter substrate-binding protein [Opitutaceae bacterium]